MAAQNWRNTLAAKDRGDAGLVEMYEAEKALAEAVDRMEGKAC